ncbi:MAG: hypothetical protein SNJ77_00435 [Cytophagales bacterium]
MNMNLLLNAASGYDQSYFKYSIAVIMGLSVLLFSVIYWFAPKLRGYIRPLLMFSIIGLMIGLALVFSLKK